jgi:hypothetical protein
MSIKVESQLRATPSRKTKEIGRTNLALLLLVLLLSLDDSLDRVSNERLDLGEDGELRLAAGALLLLLLAALLLVGLKLGDGLGRLGLGHLGVVVVVVLVQRDGLEGLLDGVRVLGDGGSRLQRANDVFVSVFA